MENRHREKDAEEKNKRRGLILALFIHVIFIIIGLIPFLKHDREEPIKGISIAFEEIKIEEPTPPEPEPEPEIEDLSFDESGSSDPDDPMGETEDPMEQEAAPETPEPVEPTPEPTPPAPPAPEEVPEPTPETAPEPTPPAPAPPAPPVQTTPEPSPVEVPPAPTPPKPVPPKPAPPAPPAPKPAPVPSPPKDPTSKPTPSKPKPTPKPETTPGNGNSSHTSTNDGNEPGKPGRPDGTDDGGNPGNGGTGGDGEGTGIGDGDGYGFARKVENRPRIDQINAMAMGKKGKIFLDICLSRDGKVISAKAIKSKSTIKDDRILARAEKLMKRYKYKADARAPKKHCHHFIFNIKDDKAATNRVIPSSYDSYEDTFFFKSVE